MKPLSELAAALEIRYAFAESWAPEYVNAVLSRWPIKHCVQGTCKYGTRVDYLLASPDCPYKFIPGSYSVLSSKGTSDHHIVKVDVTKCENRLVLSTSSHLYRFRHDRSEFLRFN
ncbi:hypothetical protein ACJRO7_030518 [Eucalyptus globulus]|uniref:Uncharacterized protein n=1 Tax=Eucalyptus globulus TaxID=34317 RepID=A0ABD3JMK7_EUCGL